MAPSALLYGLDDRPPLGRLLLYGLQWAVLVLPILAMATNLAAGFLGHAGLAKAELGQRLSLLIGLTMILQGLAGHRLPLVDGPSGALLLLLITLAPLGEATVRGAMLAGGLLLALASHLGLLKKIEAYFTPTLSATIILLIAFTSLPFFVPLALGVEPGRPIGEPATAGLALAVTFLIPALSHRLRGFAKTLSFLLGLLAGTAAFALLGRADLPGWAELAWLSLPRLWPESGLSFDPAGLLAAGLAYVVVVINLQGSLASVMEVVGGADPAGRLRRGAAVAGWAGAAAGALGLYGPVAYAISPGVILATGVGSRFATAMAGGLILALGFSPKAAALLAGVPLPVVAAAMTAAMAGQVGAGLGLLTRRDNPLTGRDYFIVGLPLLLGTMASLLSRDFLNLLPPLLGPLLGNGLVVGLLSLLLLDRLLLRQR